MGKPKKQTSPRKTGLRRSHLALKLARIVNGKSPVKAYTTVNETGRRRNESAKKASDKKTSATKASGKKEVAKK